MGWTGAGMWWSSLLALSVLAVPSQEAVVGVLQLRLVDGSANNEGRVEVRRFSNESWGTVCGNNWDAKDAAVVCRQVNPTYAWGLAIRYSYPFGEGTGPIYLSNTYCRGNETNLGNCQTNPWGTTHWGCSHYDDVGVECYRYTVRLRPQRGGYVGATYGSVAMLNTTTYSWIDLCDSDWDDNDAKVACKSAGFVDGKSLCCGNLSSGYAYSWRGSVSNIGCSGTESSLASCTYTYSRSGCPRSPGLASAICYSQPRQSVDNSFEIRLLNGSSNWGRVEVKHLGAWGSVCAGDTWNDSAADVACRQMTGRGGGVVLGTPFSDVFKGSTWITSLNCSGNEDSLEDCVVPPWGSRTYYCSSQYALCYGSNAPVVELVGGSDGSHGRVEIVMDGSRYTVCDTNWNLRDASVVCKNLGYGGGVAMKSSHYGKGSGQVAMSRVSCWGGESSLLQCASTGWLKSDSRCDTHAKDAGVYCHGHVVLRQGDHSNGVVQLIIGTTYYTICGTGFGNEEAGVVCRDHGFENGRKLAEGSYGSFTYSWRGWKTLSCVGNETSVFNCTIGTGVCYSNSRTNYAAVHCYNGSLDTSSTISLTKGIGDYVNSSGHVMLYQNGVMSRICPLSWDDKDAKVACIQLGFSGGLAYGLSTANVGPFRWGQFNCEGTESSLFNCPVTNTSCTSVTYYHPLDGGAFCYNDDSPEVQLVGGSSDRDGRVELVYRGIRGTVCISYSYYQDKAAEVICKSLGHASGTAKSTQEGTGRIALSGVQCSGVESSLLGCKNQGFMAPPTDFCNQHTSDLAVTCQDEVELFFTTQQTNTSIAGVVMLYKGNRWNYICGTFFDDVDAGVVCRKLGYGYFKALPKGAFGNKYFSSNVVGGVNCTGSETSLGSCPMTVGTCQNNRNYRNYGSVLCSKVPIPQGIQAVQPSTMPGDVLVKVDGFQSNVCSGQWEDTDARIYCRDLGYTFGRVFGTDNAYAYGAIRLVSNITCQGSENSFGSCMFSTTSTCTTYRNAKVFCYNRLEDFQIRLVGGPVRYEGNVEIGINGQWGSVCDTRYGWRAADANVVCRSLGFAGGDNVNPGTYGPAANPTFIINPSCTGLEDNITACSMSLFNQSRYADYWNCDSNPVSVQCSGEVKLVPNATYGALQMLVNASSSSFGLVCADGFGPSEAKVACRDLGFPYGLQMSGSAFGYIYRPRIQRTNLQCSGNEPVLSACSVSDNMDCPSRMYASVVCSKLSPNTGYRVEVETTLGYSYGRARVQHMGYWGYICPNNFDNNDAAVVCKEVGYAGGVSFLYQKYRRSPYTDIRWLNQLACTGQESYLIRCPGVVWGNITHCSSYADAGVFCYQRSAPQLRLVNGTRSRGRLELVSDDVTGSVCGISWYDSNAQTACRSMGFNSGRSLGAGAYGQGTGDILVEDAYCNGGEKSFFDCYLQFKGTSSYSSSCDSHDAAVQCFNTTRLTGSMLPTYGRVEVLSNQTWMAVCDQGFDTNAARVVCRDLEYSEARPQCCSALGPLSPMGHSLFAQKIGIKVNHCDGSENTLLDCDVTVTDTCSSGKYASVLCSNDPIRESRLQTRLVESVYGVDRTYVGSVQVNRYGFWGPVCNSSWDDRDANATCHGLGYNYGISFYGRDGTRKPLVVGKFQCTGQESSLADCQFGDIDDDLNCSLPMYNYLRVDAGALCFNIPGIGIRLADGGPRHGRLEIQYEGEWGRVTDYYWSSSDANIACKQLGFTGGTSPPYSMKVNHPDRRAKIWMSNVHCFGNERTLFECFNYWDYQSYYSTDANVICYNKIRLSRGNSVSVGILDVNINNKWGAVCDNEWSAVNTRVACRNLGFDDGLHLCCDPFGRKYYPLMESVSCSNTDTDLTTCSHEIPSKGMCTASSVAVACYKGSRPTAYNYTLDGGPGNNTGEVRMNYMNISGRICSDGWDDNDAKVFCSERGFQYGQAYEHILYNYYYYDATSGPFWTTNVNCQGTEARLRDCQFTVGSVSQCHRQKAAGVMCTNTEGIFFRLQGGSSRFKGRVEVAVDGVWGTVCRWSLGWRGARVFCRSQGFREGRVDYEASGYPNPPSKIYENNIQCTGTESSLEQCPHTGWKTATSVHCTHEYDASVICFDDVRIGGRFDPSNRQGSVQFYHNGTWYNLCDSGFDDVTAKRVCQDLEFVDGKAICCSGYGTSSWYVYGYETHLNYTMHCLGDERSSSECIKQNKCDSGSYASVVCFGSNDYVDESTYTFNFQNNSKTSGLVTVTHMNITGHVCSNGWDDNDARVLCNSKGHLQGIAYNHYQYSYGTIVDRGPFWVSRFNCTGTETSLNQCPFQDRLHLGNCNESHFAGAVCFNDSGIQYRISSDVPKANKGRVEISVGGVWGTVCKYSWDQNNAKVFCRNLGYNDGYAIENTFGTKGSGPMWLSNMHCKGTENALHQCPHEGFNDAPVDDMGYGCSSHINDAYVFCVDKVKLNTEYGDPGGAVMVYRQNQWNLICDSGLDHAGAHVVCRQMDFQFGTFLQGSKFGRVNASITISSVKCKGTEADFSTCTFVDSSACGSQNYASVVCSNDPIQEESPNVRIIRDDPKEPRHGFLEYQVAGVWGAMCAATMDTNTASVACRQLGFTGGVPYTPYKYDYRLQPILTSNVKCEGTESLLDQCPRVTWPAPVWCDYYAPRAGVLCYNDTGGISYRLAGEAADNMRGRVEMKYMGQYGIFCTYYSNTGAARVACKSLGFADGLPLSGTRFSVSQNVPVWFHNIYCGNGNQSSLPECWTTGFNMSSWYGDSYRYWCLQRMGPFSVQCYQEELAITDVRLVDGDTNSSGRVEVFLKGPNKWGTVCDDLWDDVDATVVCNQLGFATGRAVVRAGFGQGHGDIWMDNVGCKGHETRLQDCGFQGFSEHNCRHSEDAGAICSGVYVLPTTTTVKPPTRPTPSPRTTPTSVKPTRNTNKPVTKKTVGGNESSKTAAIVTPIVIILVVAIVAVVGIILYRRRQMGNKPKRLEETGMPSSSGPVSFGQGGVVRFMNRMRTLGKREGGNDDPQGITNPSYENPAGVFASDHADFSSDA